MSSIIKVYKQTILVNLISISSYIKIIKIHILLSCYIRNNLNDCELYSI